MFLATNESVKYYKEINLNILIIEYNYFHDEVLIPQIDLVYKNFLKNKSGNLFLITNVNILKRKTFDVSLCKMIENKVRIKFIKKKYNKLTKYTNFLYVMQTLSFIYKHDIDSIVFNTIDSYNEDIELLLKLLPSKIKKIGILHNGDKINNYYEKYDKIIVLSELVANFLKKEKVDYIYPLFYKYKNKSPWINKDKLVISIPGNIEESRRDYKFIIEFVFNNQQFCENNKIEFILLGNINSTYGKKISQLIKEKRIEKFFKLFDAFIDYNKFIETIFKSDIVMPLIDKNVNNFSNYMNTKISASFNMAYSCNKPLLMYKDFKNSEFEKFSFFYEDEFSLKKILKMISLNKNILNEKIELLQKESKFDYIYQSNKYLQIIENKKSNK